MNKFELYEHCESRSAMPISRLAALDELLTGHTLPGDWVQAGVWRGGSAALLGLIAGRQGIKRNLWLYDMWDKMPEPTHPDGRKATEVMENGDYLEADFDEVKLFLEDTLEALFAYRDLQCHMIRGDVKFTTASPHYEGQDIAVLHIDVDWYESTKVVFDNLYDRVAPGGLVIIDDYGHWKGTQEATDEFLAERKINPRELQILDSTCRYFRKQQNHLQMQDEAMNIIAELAFDFPKVVDVLNTVRKYIPGIKVKREISEFQAAALYVLAKQFNQEDDIILEIGTAHGYSAAILKEGTGRGNVITLNPDKHEVEIAQHNLRHYTRLKILSLHSHVYLNGIVNDITPPTFDMIFVDGDHNNIHLDLPY